MGTLGAHHMCKTFLGERGDTYWMTPWRTKVISGKAIFEDGGGG